MTQLKFSLNKIMDDIVPVIHNSTSFRLRTDVRRSIRIPVIISINSTTTT